MPEASPMDDLREVIADLTDEAAPVATEQQAVFTPDSPAPPDAGDAPAVAAPDQEPDQEQAQGQDQEHVEQLTIELKEQGGTASLVLSWSTYRLSADFKVGS